MFRPSLQMIIWNYQAQMKEDQDLQVKIVLPTAPLRGGKKNMSENF